MIPVRAGACHILPVAWSRSVLDKQDDLNAPLPDSPSELSRTFAEGIWREFFPKLAGYAREKLGNTPRRDVDEEDIALSAINSFFTGVRQGRFTVEERGDLWRLLATITARKVTRQHRRFFSEKRGSGKVRGESAFRRNDNDSAKTGLDQFIDESRMPELQDQIIATCEDLLAMLKDENLRKTALMRMDGYSNREISETLGCSVARTKQRLQKIRELWEDVAID